MATLKASAKLDVRITIELNECEARALDALVGYGVEEFKKVFYEHLGRAYLEPSERGLDSLFDYLRDELPPQLRRIDKAREVWNGGAAE